MSTREQMEYLEEPQTLRNKDYITIKRNIYDLLKKSRTVNQEQDLREKLLGQREIDLNRREQDIKKKELMIKYELHKKILDFAKQFMVDKSVT